MDKGGENKRESAEWYTRLSFTGGSRRDCSQWHLRSSEGTK